MFPFFFSASTTSFACPGGTRMSFSPCCTSNGAFTALM